MKDLRKLTKNETLNLESLLNKEHIHTISFSEKIDGFFLGIKYDENGIWFKSNRSPWVQNYSRWFCETYNSSEDVPFFVKYFNSLMHNISKSLFLNCCEKLFQRIGPFELYGDVLDPKIATYEGFSKTYKFIQVKYPKECFEFIVPHFYIHSTSNNLSHIDLYSYFNKDKSNMFLIILLKRFIKTFKCDDLTNMNKNIDEFEKIVLQNKKLIYNFIREQEVFTEGFVINFHEIEKSFKIKYHVHDQNLFNPILKG